VLSLAAALPTGLWPPLGRDMSVQLRTRAPEAAAAPSIHAGENRTDRKPIYAIAKSPNSPLGYSQALAILT
jgi:hypothetical protein